MTRISHNLAITSIAAALAAASAAHAIDYNWNVLGGGTQTWATPANWSPNTAFPNSIADTANLTVALTGNLNVDVGTSPITVGGLNLGGTGAAVTTDIVGGVGGKLILSDNNDADFNDDNRIDGTDFMIWQANVGSGTTHATGDANFDGRVDGADLRAWRNVAMRTFTPATPPAPTNFPGTIEINSNGAAGTVNRISVPVRSGVLVDIAPTPPIHRTETVEVRGTQGLNLAGGYRLSGAGNTLNTLLPAGATLTINGIVLEEDDAPADENRTLNINTSQTALGRVEIPGTITGGGGLVLGHTSTGVRDNATYVFSGNNNYTGSTVANRATIIVASDTAFGTGVLSTGNPSNWLATRVQSDNDARVISARVQVAQYFTFDGQNSLTLAGIVNQSNSRGIVNLLPTPKTLTISGTLYGRDDATVGRPFTFDGTGTTVVTGTISQHAFTGGAEVQNDGTTNIVKQGDGALYLNGAMNYTGTTTFSGGNLHFASADSLATSDITGSFGAIGVDTGTSLLTGSGSAFWIKFNPTSASGVMLRSTEAAANVDFTAGDLSTFEGRLSLAAPEGGISYTGTITPFNATYALGGGGGTLTLPNATLTGANKVVAINGGVVQLNGANTFTGSVSALSKYRITLTGQALVGGQSNNTGNISREFAGTVVATTNLANGGIASGLGSSSSAASNLFLQGGTFRYNGGANASTDRLFTVGTGGATIESSGTGTVSFTNTGNLVMDAPAARAGTRNNSATITGLSSTADLVIGMAVAGTGIPTTPVTTISAINSPTSITISAAATDSSVDDLTFTGIARTLTLGGTNGGNNTLRPNIVNGNLATNVVKAGAGKWILTGTNNTYTGTTTVNGGVLQVNGTNSGNGNVSVATAGTLGGSGAITGNITVNGTLNPGSDLGALTVTGAATFNAGSTAKFEIGGTTAGLFDELNLSGALTAGGTFDIDLVNGFNPANGNSFDVLDFASATGTFSFSLPALGPGLAWNTLTLLTNGTVSVVPGVVSVPEPGTAVLAAGGLLAMVLGRRRSVRA